jgi:hypothetical protein
MKENTSKRKYVFRFEEKPPKESPSFVLKRRRFKGSDEPYRRIIEVIQSRSSNTKN